MKQIKKNKAYCFYCDKTPTEYTMKIKDERYSNVPFLIYVCKNCIEEHKNEEVSND